MHGTINKIKKIVTKSWKEFNLLTLFTPLMLAGGIVLFLLSDSVAHMEGIGPNTFKVALENIAFLILVPAILISYLRFCIERSLFFLWFTSILFSLFCREVHWDWASNGIYVLLILLMFIAIIFYEKLEPQISSSAFINLFIAGILCYSISNFLLDHNWLQISKEYRSDIKFRKSLEEFIETGGHSIMAMITLLTPALTSKKSIKIIDNKID